MRRSAAPSICSPPSRRRAQSFLRASVARTARPRLGTRFPTRRSFAACLTTRGRGAGSGRSSASFRVRLVLPPGRFLVGVPIGRGAVARLWPGLLR